MADVITSDTGQLARYDALVSIAKTLAGHKTVTELFQVLAHHLRSIVPFDALALILHDEKTDDMRLVVLEPTSIVPPSLMVPVADRGPAATVWETQQGAVVVVPDEGPVPPAIAYIHGLGQKVACLLPLTTARRKLGVLAFASRSASAYSDQALAFMEQIAGVVAVAVENKINYDEAQRHQRELREERDRLHFLLDINNLLVSRLDHRALLKAIFETVQRVIDGRPRQRGVLRSGIQGAAARRRASTASRGFSSSDATLPLDQTIAGATLETRRGDGVPAVRPGRGPAGQRRGDERLRYRIGVLRAARHRNGRLGALYVGRTTTDCVLGGGRHAARARVGADRHRRRRTPAPTRR